MKKRLISLLLVAVMLLGMIPMQIFAEGDSEKTQVIDTSWYDSSAASGTVFEIADTADLRGAARLSQEGETFSGYTLKLMNNLDLNPGWDAEVKISGGNATLPDAPTVEFEGFATFAGTLDGNGKTVSGIYMAQTVNASNPNLAFIKILNGTVKNLVINNSFIFADVEEGRTDHKIAGIAARTQNANALLDTLYVDIDVWYRSWGYQRIAGIVGKTDTAAATFRNIAFVGTVGNMTPDNAVPSTSTGVYMSQFIADANHKTGNVYENIVLKGTEYAAVATGKIIASNDKDEVSKETVTVGTNAELPAAVQAMNPPAEYKSALAAFNIWPSGVMADSKTPSYDEGKQAYVKYYQKATSEQYTNYLYALKDADYNADMEYSVGGNSYALYQKAGEYSVFVSYLGKVGNVGEARMRVFVEPFGSAYQYNDTATTSSVCSAQVWQLDVDNATDDGGMSYVIRLTDGTFIVIDGGYKTDKEAQNLYKVLSNNNVNGGKPVIKAWFFTHLHSDHVGGFIRFANKYASNVTVEGFYYNFPGSDVASSSNSISTSAIKDVEMAMNKFDGAMRYRKIHSGMTFGFAGVTATVLGTHEDVNQSYWKDETFRDSIEKNTMDDGNDTSTVIKFTIGTQTLTILGDAGMPMSYQLLHTYSASTLKSDMVQMSHHGYKGAKDELYEKIDADVVLWPMDVVGHDGKSIFSDYYNRTNISANAYVKENASEVIPAYENACLEMPYAATTYSSGKVIDIDATYEEKLNRLATEQSGPDTSWYDESKSVYYLWDAYDVLGFATKAAGGDTFAGKTIMLMADIDLNPGWSADVTIDSKVNFPSAAPVSWPDIPSFAGTFDGNGYTLSGIYVKEDVVGETGTHGGLFDVLAGGTIKNLRISNSLIHMKHTTGTYGNHSIVVGGIAGQVNQGSELYNVYMDNTVEVWYQSDKQCVLGGAFGRAAGAYNLAGFVFVGTLGHTSNSCQAKYANSGEMIIGLVIADQASKGGYIRNTLTLGSSIHSGIEKPYRNHDRVAMNPGSEAIMTCLANTICTESWLGTRPEDYGYYFTWSTVLKGANESTTGCIVPREAETLVNGTYVHAVPEIASGFANDTVIYVYTAEQLLSVLKNGGDFAGKTIKLMNDIDLNPGWSAKVDTKKKTDGSSERLVFPSVPNRVWPDVASFAGTFDGNGYTVRGIYSVEAVSGNTGDYGGMFDILSGTVKNLKIENSFMLTYNTAANGASTPGINVGGIAGLVKANSQLNGVYMDAEVWFLSAGNCFLGGAFGKADGIYYVNGFVFAGRVGNTNTSFNPNYAVANDRTIFIAALIGSQNWKANGAYLSDVILTGSRHSGKNQNSSWNNPLLGCNFNDWSMTRFVGGKLTESDLASDSRKNLRDAGWVYLADAQSAVPSNVASILMGTFEHVVDDAAKFATPEIAYQLSAVENGAYDIRFVSGLNHVEDLTAVGFDITLTVGKDSYKIARSETMRTDVYTYVWADGEKVTAKDFNENYDYLYTCVISGVAAMDRVTIDIAVVYECGGETLVGSTVTYEFVNGTAHVIG